ncbi:sigma-70 family RNA polymerase sigma factor [Roseovarius salis]|uniref:sigma-70 family RNA polymerase sigma factor n=1 Tax=Roseovarius salis TaxID=3376063 RepID=UPI0037C8816E
MNKPYIPAARSNTARSGPAMLDAEEERRLARAWRDEGDVAARNRLVTAFTPLVLSITQRFTKTRAQEDPDLVQHAFIGLMRAADGFDPDRGVRFSTYASWWVRAELQDYRMANWSIVRRGRSAKVRKAFFKLGPVEDSLPSVPGETASERNLRIADKLGVGVHELDDMRRQFAARDSSLNRMTGEEEDTEAVDLLPDPDADVEAQVAARRDGAAFRAAMVRHFRRLPEREREIVIANVLLDPPKTLNELAQDHGISRERVRQLRERGLERLREAIAETGDALPSPA